MPSLYDLGWRRGAVLRANLTAAATVVQDGAIKEVSRPFGLWMVATQDCDLAAVDDTDPEPTVELRPLLADDPPPLFGIRSRKLRVSHEHHEYLLSESLRCMVSPEALSMLVGERPASREDDWLDDGELRALQTWLGLRYDRPAVPPELVPLATALAEAIERRRRHPALSEVRDVLAQYDTNIAPPQFRLVAVVTSAADKNVVRDLLIEVALRIPLELGVMAAVDVGTAADVSIDVIETSYAVDLTKITWGKGRPEGAE